MSALVLPLRPDLWAGCTQAILPAFDYFDNFVADIIRGHFHERRYR